MTPEEVCAMLHISLPTLHRWRHAGRISEPRRKDGKSTVYDRAEIEALANGMKHRLAA